ncbi:unnamed protein product [Rotaria sp. Silwood2]|nr:unnamed protein product [Rotaria sp. Silwood2]CAF4213104.1 unnamed protein product [Rotaria sp. Silwood2]
MGGSSSKKNTNTTPVWTPTTVTKPAPVPTTAPRALYELIDASPEKVSEGCLHLYTMETFLRTEMNKFLREANKEKLVTYGPFLRLLYFTFNEPSTVEVHSTTVYHGMNLIQSDIDLYKRAADDNTTLRWMSFTSTTANREFAEIQFFLNTFYGVV